jgi:two-component system chemotaxis response regulator CheY
MLNILVVDDVDLNRHFLVKSINRIAKSLNQTFNVIEASDGKEALEYTQKSSVDLIFMDIVMPNMNGIEATKKIKEQTPLVMIIAVSTLEDQKSQQKILENGAEDYITKPINLDLFKSRLKNYLKLLASRNTLHFKKGTKNAFASRIYNYTISFSIENEDDLAQVWEALLRRFEFQKQIQDLSDFIRLIYRIGTLQLHYKYIFEIYLEEDKSQFYFSMNNMLLLNVNQLVELITTYYPNIFYKIDHDILSFSVDKIEVKNTEYVDKLLDDSLEEEIIEVTTPVEIEEIELLIFDLLDEADMEDLDENMRSLNLFVYLIGNATLHAEDVVELCQSLNRLSTILNYSPQCCHITEIFREFTALFENNVDLIVKKSESVAIFISPFIKDIIMWKNMVFFEGAPSVDFLNDSFKSNILMIEELLHPKVSDELDTLDDIFDF